MLLVGCDQSEEIEFDLSDEATPTAPTAEAESELAAPLSPEAVPLELVVGECPGAMRLIGVLDSPSDDCALGGALPSEWSQTSLFQSGSPGVQAMGLVIPHELERYCAYDYAGPEGQVASHYAALTSAVDSYAAMDATTLSADCRGEYEQGTLYDPSVGAELRDSFLTNIGWDAGAGLVDGDAASARDFIDVAVVDTVSQAAADDPNIFPVSEHGLQMAGLINEVDCPAGGAACSAAIHHVLALPRDTASSTPDWVVGGTHGSQGDLAMGIYQAVETWYEARSQDSANTSPRLVINLSVGWTGLDGEPLESARGPHAAVLAAARFAACHGALMIAAAGNADDERCPDDSDGPLAPAAFEAIAAPTLGECTALGLDHLSPWAFSYSVYGGNGSGYRPLVHAIAGVDAADAPLLNARADSSPRLVALGSTGISDPGAEVLAGSSVSAAVASGAAALLWSYRPDLRGHQIMQLLYDTGWDTGRDADVGPADPVHRMSVCAALAEACENSGDDDCPTPSCDAQAPAADGNLGGFGLAVDAVLADSGTTLESYVSLAPEEFPVCGGAEAGTTDLASPQPDIPLCSRCNLGTGKFATPSDDSVSMTIDASYAGMVTAVTLITDDGETRSFQRFDSTIIDSLNRQPEPVDVTRVWVDTPKVVSASLEFMLVDGSSQTNTIQVYERAI